MKDRGKGAADNSPEDSEDRYLSTNSMSMGVRVGYGINRSNDHMLKKKHLRR